MTDLKHQIEGSLAGFKNKDLKPAAIGFLNALGYQSDKVLDLESTPQAFLAQFDRRDRPLRKDKALFDRWKSVEFLFQITDEEVRNAGAQASLGFDSAYDSKNYQSYLFLALDLEKDHYTRTNLSSITREVNRLFDMPAMLLMRQNGTLTFSVIDRRISRRDESRDVLEKVKLIKDIRYEKPHRAHTDILHDLALSSILSQFRCRDFQDLHRAWRQVLDIEVLNKRFYDRIAEWFFMAVQNVRFPHGGVDNEDVRNRISLIRLLTRIVFCWFAKEKQLIPEALFEPSTAARVLKRFDESSLKDGNYYRAILQNLFFPTLSIPLNEREFREGRRYRGRNDDYMDHSRFRYETLFKDPEELGRLFSDIPFLNGGLFECLDYVEKRDGKNVEVRVDGFSDRDDNNLRVPDALFFGREIRANLSEAYDTEKKSDVRVDGLFHILNAYKFTVSENTPIEEEIALDPELLGRIFENLLAEYNPETEKTARKETGSFYTPRAVVNYMVDVSLKGYLKQQLKNQSAGLSDKELDVRLDDLLNYTEKTPELAAAQKRALADSIYDIKVLDPACGSGAFPIGMLHKLIFVLDKLDADHHRWKERVLKDTPSALRDETSALLDRSSAEYTWKLALIQRAIYGIDIQPIAVQIAKLRCFISLLVDFEVDRKAENFGVPALPNLDFKFVAADTLTRPPGAQRLGELAGLEDPFFEEFAKAAEDYFFVRDPKEKRKLRDAIEALISKKISENERALIGHRGDGELSEAIQKALRSKNQATIERIEREIRLWNSYRNIFAFRNDYVRFFDPRYFFPEIKQGFDIVIGNPPYMRIQGIREQDPAAADYYVNNYETATGSFDLYVIFTERGLELLRPSGILNYIMPDKWVHASFGCGLRRKVSAERLAERIISFGAHQVFTACTYSSLLWLTKNQNANIQFTRIEPADDADVDLAHELAQIERHSFTAIGYEQLSDEPWILTGGAQNEIMDQLAKNHRYLSDVFHIFVGLQTSKDPIYFLHDAKHSRDIVEAHSPELDERVAVERDLVKPLLLGDQVHRYEHLESDKVVIFPYHLPESSEGKAKLMEPEFIRRHYPQGWAYLKKCEGVLRRRERGRFDCDEWYQFGRKQGIGNGGIPKLLAPDISLGGNFAFDPKGEFYTTTTLYGYIKKPSARERHEFWLGVLNSRVLWFYLRNSGSVLANGYFRYKPAYLEGFPVPKPSDEQESIVARLVDYIQFLKALHRGGDPDKDIVAAFLDELIDVCVMEVYFPEHLAEKKLAVVGAVREILLRFPPAASAAEKRKQIQALYETANNPKHTIRNRLMRVSIDSPDFLRVIKEENKG